VAGRAEVGAYASKRWREADWLRAGKDGVASIYKLLRSWNRHTARSDPARVGASPHPRLMDVTSFTLEEPPASVEIVVGISEKPELAPVAIHARVQHRTHLLHEGFRRERFLQNWGGLTQ
jgi:hypothetical protein